MSSTTSVTSSSTTTTATSAASDSSKSFRDADFMSIMLAEVTHQSPFDPQDTGKMVENMQKLQELANSKYDKYRSDLSWAQQLMGQNVTVQQMAITDSEKQALVEKGVNPDVGYAQVTGRVETYRTIDEQVYVTIGGKDYPLDNLKQVVPAKGAEMAAIADRMLGKTVSYYDTSSSTSVSGTVSAVSAGTDGGTVLTVDGVQVPYENLLQISL